MNNLVIFALVFQIPLVILFIDRIKPLTPRGLLRYQRHIIVGAFVLALILPFTYDPISQFVVAIPIVVLYYLSVILVWRASRRRRHNLHAQSPVAPVAVPMAPALASPVVRRGRPRHVNTIRHLDGIAYRPLPRVSSD